MRILILFAKEKGDGMIAPLNCKRASPANKDKLNGELSLERATGKYDSVELVSVSVPSGRLSELLGDRAMSLVGSGIKIVSLPACKKCGSELVQVMIAGKPLIVLGRNMFHCEEHGHRILIKTRE